MTDKYTSLEKQHHLNRCHAENRSKVYKKIRKPVLWNGIKFESMERLRGHLKLLSTSNIQQAIKKKRPLKGHIPEFITKE